MPAPTPQRRTGRHGRHDTLIGYSSAQHGFEPRVRAAEMEEAELDDRAEQVGELADGGAAYKEIGTCARS
ncbi:hypothetical protein [Streptomyces sp. NPDC102264]|uniref:hypothetical protein n=1 Tax=Streptomyces sp. NPDC102264 TaxID=3366149 RepID=UPI0037F9CD8C